MTHRPLRTPTLRTFCLIEQNRLAYLADFAAYCAAIGLISMYLMVTQSTMGLGVILLLMFCGYMSWSLIEYCLHRFILHQYPPFMHWHGEHHRQPHAFICTATPVSMASIWLLIYLPVRLLTSTTIACSFTLGLLIGYLWYALLHHAIHHWHTMHMPWLVQKRRLHRLHHHHPDYQFGVTTDYWDCWLRTRHADHHTHN